MLTHEVHIEKIDGKFVVRGMMKGKEQTKIYLTERDLYCHLYKYLGFDEETEAAFYIRKAVEKEDMKRRKLSKFIAGEDYSAD